MYLHLGNDVIVKKSDIVGIFDIENTTTGKNTGHLLDRAQKEGRVINVTYEMPKSFVICMQDGEEKVYVCQMSAATLRKRI
ncbi:MAG: DUF370 domain-containing protein [Oscillospiraceae bacterium]|nr:DUF370 domain-containing protein [Oscillospiraceae bacterium]